MDAINRRRSDMAGKIPPRVDVIQNGASREDRELFPTSSGKCAIGGARAVG
jgi:hypothetical protein